MQQILGSRNHQLLRRFALSHTLLAFDFDGTLAPIVSHPDRAAMRRSTRECLAKLSTLYPCVVISGRARGDVSRRLAGTAVKQVIGNHGIEPWSTTSAMEQEVARWMLQLQEKLRPLRALALENKKFSIAIHYRNEPRKHAALAAITAAARHLGHARIIGGKYVVNILPAGAPHKGEALKQALLKTRCNKAIYVGDDVTDEDVFALPGEKRLMSIRVGRSRNSLAKYYIPTQVDIDRLLQTLISLRSCC